MEADSNLTPKNPKKRNRIASPSETVINIDNNLIQTSMTQLEKTENNLKDIRDELLEVKETIEKTRNACNAIRYFCRNSHKFII